MPSPETPESQPEQSLSPETREAMRRLGIPERIDAEPSDPINLRAVPPEQWEQYDCFPVLLPPDVEHYLAGIEGEMSVLEKDYLEERIETFHGVKLPWGICFAAGKARLMRGIS